MPLEARRSRPGRSLSAAFGEVLTTDVLTIQCGLWQLGFDPGRFDGLMGPVTASALARWHNWFRSRMYANGTYPDVSPSLEDPYWRFQVPASNRGGAVRMPSEYSEIVQAAARGRCQLEARGAHQIPPVREPYPVEMPTVVVNPDTQEPEPVPAPPPIITVVGEGGSGMALTLLGLGVLGIGAYLLFRKDSPIDPVDEDLYTFKPIRPLTSR